MQFGRGDTNKSLISYLVYSFDFDAVRSLTGFEQQEVMAVINEYDKRMDELGISGLIDISYIVAEALTGIVSEIRYDVDDQQLTATDYFTLLYDMLTNEEENFSDLDDIVHQASRLCLRIHNFLVIGFTNYLSNSERNYLASILAMQYDIPEDDNIKELVLLNEDVLVFTCLIPEILDDNEDSVQLLHSRVLARINRRLSSTTSAD